MSESAPESGTLAELIDRWSTAAQAYMDGDLRTYAALAAHASDYTLLRPDGGDPRRGFDSSDEAVEWTARVFRGGTVELDVFQTYASGDLAVPGRRRAAARDGRRTAGAGLVAAPHAGLPPGRRAVAPRPSARRSADPGHRAGALRSDRPW